MLSYLLTLKGPHEGSSAMGNIWLVEYVDTHTRYVEVVCLTQKCMK